jgi:hypothetical protein
VNQYFIIALLWAASLVGLGLYENNAGHTTGVNEQKVADQKQFDTINQKTADQKAEANRMFREMQDINLATAVERDKLKTKLEKEHAANQKVTADLSAKYSGLKLRFTAQVAGSGDGSGSPQGPAVGGTGAQPATVIQLPDALTAGLRSIVTDADNLAADYKLCYDYANQIK